MDDLDRLNAAERAARARPTTEVNLSAVGVILYIAGAVCVGVGFFTMYRYGGGWGQLVNADAYNYLIIGIRGLGWIVLGCALAIIGAIYESLDHRRP